MKIRNIGSKIIGIGEETVLPGEVKEVPKAFERSPILEVYKEIGMAEIITDSVTGMPQSRNEQSCYRKR